MNGRSADMLRGMTGINRKRQVNLFDPDVLLWHAESGFKPEFLAHLAEVRMALEPEAAALASQRRTEEGVTLITPPMIERYLASQ